MPQPRVGTLQSATLQSLLEPSYLKTIRQLQKPSIQDAIKASQINTSALKLQAFQKPSIQEAFKASQINTSALKLQALQKPAFADAMKALQKPAFADAIKTLQTPTYIKTLEQLSRPSVLDQVRSSFTKSSALAAREALATNRSFQKSIAESRALTMKLQDLGGFTKTIESLAAPGVAWKSLVDDLRPALPDDLYVDVSDEFEDVDDIGDGSWIDTLPEPRQIRLLTDSLALISAATIFAAVATDTPLPPTYVAAVAVLFALVTLILNQIDG